MDLQTARQRVQEYVIDLPSETVGLIDSWINKAIRTAEERYNFRYMADVLSSTTVEGERKLDDKPGLWKEAGSAPWLQRDDGSNRELEWAPSKSEMVRDFAVEDPDDKGSPRAILETADELRVFPFPDGESDYTDGEYRVRTPYWRFSEVLSSNEDTNALMTAAPWFVVYYAVSEALIFNRDEARGGAYASKAEQEFVKARLVDKRSRLPDRMTLVPRRDVFGSAMNRRTRYRRL